jgi:hypothetical protein
LGHIFSLILSREITDEESGILREAGCDSAVFLTDALPTNAEITVTRLNFDDSVTPTLAESIEAALEAVKKVPDLTVPGLSVPAVPKAAKESSAEDAEASAPDAVVQVVEAAPGKKRAGKKKAEVAAAAE